MAPAEFISTIGQLELVEACRECDVERASSLLEERTYSNEIMNKALIEACKHNDMELLEILVEYGADINAQNVIFQGAKVNAQDCEAIRGCGK